MDKKIKQINKSDNQIIIGKIIKKQLNKENPESETKETETETKNIIDIKIEQLDINEDIIEPINKSHYCYILRNSYEPDKNRTYNGYTVNPSKRIRQHNQEIKGGAIYTKSWGNKSWEIYVLITGFPDHHNALQCEWKYST